MKPIVKVLLRRCAMTLGAIVVWAKTLARGSADEEARSMPNRSKDGGEREQKPNREP
jgi:hypothetical protein